MENKNSSKGMQFLDKMWKMLCTREVITYLIAGVLTTVVNLLVSYLAYEIAGIEELIANTIAWVAAVAFAYVVNSYWVFRSGFVSAGDEVKKIVKFFAGRGVTYLVEQAGILVFVKLMGIPFMLIKGVLAIVVIILNYLVSKIFIFKNKKQENEKIQ